MLKLGPVSPTTSLTLRLEIWDLKQFGGLKPFWGRHSQHHNQVILLPF